MSKKETISSECYADKGGILCKKIYAIRSKLNDKFVLEHRQFQDGTELIMGCLRDEPKAGKRKDQDGSGRTSRGNGRGV